jgi:hypothetical protein
VFVARSGKKRKAWGKIYGSDVVGGVSNPSSTSKSFTPQPSEYDDDFNILS